MVELTILEYLKTKLTVPVYMEHPEGGIVSEYVTIERTGGAETNHIKSAVFAIQSYSKTLYGAASLNESVKEAMNDIISLQSVTACTLNSDYNYTDQTFKSYRYQAVFNVVYYGE